MLGFSHSRLFSIVSSSWRQKMKEGIRVLIQFLASSCLAFRLCVDNGKIKMDTKIMINGSSILFPLSLSFKISLVWGLFSRDRFLQDASDIAICYSRWLGIRLRYHHWKEGERKGKEKHYAISRCIWCLLGNKKKVPMRNLWVLEVSSISRRLHWGWVYKLE